MFHIKTIKLIMPCKTNIVRNSIGISSDVTALVKKLKIIKGKNKSGMSWEIKLDFACFFTFGLELANKTINGKRIGAKQTLK